MSLAGAQLTMRATTTRNAGAVDRYGHPPVSGPWTPQPGPLHCYVWLAQVRESVDAVKAGTVEPMRAVFRADADIKRGDRVVELVNRRGRRVLEGTLEVDAVEPRTIGSAPACKMVQLRRAVA